MMSQTSANAAAMPDALLRQVQFRAGRCDWSHPISLIYLFIQCLKCAALLLLHIFTPSRPHFRTSQNNNLPKGTHSHSTCRYLLVVGQGSVKVSDPIVKTHSLLSLHLKHWKRVLITRLWE